MFQLYQAETANAMQADVINKCDLQQQHLNQNKN